MYTIHLHRRDKHLPLRRTRVDGGGASARDGVLSAAPRLLVIGHRSGCCVAGGRARGDPYGLDTSPFLRRPTPPSSFLFIATDGIRLRRHHRGAALAAGRVRP
jgi:hypothetical protein